MKNRLLYIVLQLLILPMLHAQAPLAPERTWEIKPGKDPARGVVVYTATGFIATNEGKGIRLFNPQSGKNTLLSGHKGEVRLLQNSPDNKYLLSASDERIRLWDLVTLTDIEVKTDVLTAQMWAGAMAVSAATTVTGEVADKAFVGTNLGRGIRKLGDNVSDKILNDSERAFREIKAINIARDRQCLIGNNAKDRLQILRWNAQSGRVDTIASLPNTASPDDLMYISPDNRLIAHNYTETQVTRIWEDGIERLTIPITKKLFGFSPDGAQIATAVDGGIALWDPYTGGNTGFLAADRGQEAVAFSFHRLGRFYAAVFTDKTTGQNTLALWDATSRKKLRAFGIAAPVPHGGICFNYEGNYLACRMSNNQMCTWDMRKVLDAVPSFSENIQPQFSWLSPVENTAVKAGNYALRCCITSPTPLQEVQVFVNDAPLHASRDLQVGPAPGADCTLTFEKTVTLRAGENRVYIKAVNSAGNAYSETRYLRLESPDAPAAPAKAEKRLALIIGNAAYAGTGALRNPVNDARDMANALKELGFEVMLYTDLDRRKMSEAVRLYGNKLRIYNAGLFFYAGHGIQVQGANYLVPLNANITKPEDAPFECFALDELMSNVKTTDRNNIIILDACRNNPFRNLNRGGESGGLSVVNAPAGAYIAFATAAGSVAQDGAGKNGTFTSGILQHIRTRNLTVDQLFNRVTKSVLEATKGEQEPWRSTNLTDDFFISR